MNQAHLELDHKQTAILDGLYRQHFREMLQFAARRCRCPDEAQDAVMEALLKVAPRILGVEPKARVCYWRRAILNLIIENVRHNAVLQMLSIEASQEAAEEKGEAIPEFAALDEPVYSHIETRMLENAVRASVMGLSPDHREVVVRFYFADQEIEQIGTAIGRPGGTIKSRLGRARTALSGPIKEKLRT